MPKFFVANSQVKNEIIAIEGKDVNHIKNVLRKKVGDILNICISDTQTDVTSKIKEICEDKILCEISEYKQNQVESNLKVTIFQGLPKSDKMELVIQKSVELGVYDIYPVEMKRCVMQIKDQNKKIARWQTISEVASKQSGRSIIPKIHNSIKIEEIANLIPEYDAVLLLYEEEQENKLKAELTEIKHKNCEPKIGIIIGPEGGIDKEEVQKLKQAGAKSITLGKRILRTETVALNVLSNIMYEFEK